MDDFGAAFVKDLVTGAVNFVAEVHVLRVHEEILGEEADLFEHRAANEQACARDDFDLRRLGLTTEKRPRTPERRAGKFVAQELGVEKLIQDSWEGLYAARLNRHVGVEQLGSDDTGFGPRLHAIDKRLERVPDDFGVWIEQQNKLALRMTKAQ